MTLAVGESPAIESRTDCPFPKPEGAKQLD